MNCTITLVWLAVFIQNVVKSFSSRHLGFKFPSPQKEVYKEVASVFPDGIVDYDGLKECELLERCVKETLRLRPPIMTMMRMVKETVVSEVWFFS